MIATPEMVTNARRVIQDEGVEIGAFSVALALNSALALLPDPAPEVRTGPSIMKHMRGRLEDIRFRDEAQETGYLIALYELERVLACQSAPDTTAGQEGD